MMDNILYSSMNQGSGSGRKMNHKISSKDIFEVVIAVVPYFFGFVVTFMLLEGVMMPSIFEIMEGFFFFIRGRLREIVVLWSVGIIFVFTFLIIPSFFTLIFLDMYVNRTEKDSSKMKSI